MALVKRIGFDYLLGSSRRSFPFTRIASIVSCQPFATPVMLDQNAIHNRIGITLLLWRIELTHQRFGPSLVPLSSIEAGINECAKNRCHRRRPDGSWHRLSARRCGPRHWRVRAYTRASRDLAE